MDIEKEVSRVEHLLFAIDDCSEDDAIVILQETLRRREPGASSLVMK